MTSTADNLSDGGYKVIISGGYDTSLVGWVFADKPYSSAKLQNRTCDYVALNGEAAARYILLQESGERCPGKASERSNFSLVVRSLLHYTSARFFARSPDIRSSACGCHLQPYGYRQLRMHQRIIVLL